MSTIDSGAVLPVLALSNDSYVTLVTPRGTGGSFYQGLALTRWQPHPVHDEGGLFFYLRDRERRAVWAATPAPVPAAGAPVQVAAQRGRIAFECERLGIHSRLEVGVCASRPAEVRRLRLENRSDRERTIEITAGAELVLNTAAADASHPAFSKLFVQTAFDEKRGALLARRRLRSPDDAPIWVAARLSGAGELEYETDRARFLGRGRTAAAPLALHCDTPLSGTTGNVLDPLFALRRTLRLSPGEHATLHLLLAAAPGRVDLEGTLDALADEAGLDAALESAPGSFPETALSACQLPDAWTRSLRAAPADGTWQVASATATTAGAATPEGMGRTEALVFFNGLGGFTAAGDEYVIRIERTPEGVRLPPVPWVNVVANPLAGFIISERGSGCTWAANSRENRITPWSNDPVSDPPGDALFLRDEASGEFWSLTPGPRPGAGDYEVRHGFGYTRFHHRGAGLDQELCCFVPRDLPVRVQRIRLTNRGAEPRRLSLWSCARLVLGGLAVETAGQVVIRRDDVRGALYAYNHGRGEFSARVAFSALRTEGAQPARWSTDGQAFTGMGRDLGDAAAVERGDDLDGATGAPASPCFAHQLRFELPPRASLDALVLLGEAEDEAAASAALDAFPDPAAADRALLDVVEYWSTLLGRIRIRTPAPAIDLMVNGWLAYQNLSCRLWARSAFFQSGGAFGFRDQIQDAAALLHLEPSLTRAQLLLHAAHQFVEGDVLHWWHPPTSKGIRTGFSDDLLWLPYLTAYYVNATGDRAVLDEHARFVSARPLEPGEEEAFLVPADSGTTATLYEHCCRALDRSLTRGAHGLPLMGTGDWNDGMNRVGREGRGESVWLGFFLFEILDDFIALCAQRDDEARATRYTAYREALGRALNDAGWDGAWYRRAWYDSGEPLGSAQNDECRIDTIAQAWSVISGAAPADRAELALDAMEQFLVSEPEGIIRLLTPAFDRTPHDPGYIKGYLPGVRENGGQYTHGALWAVRALAELGRGERAGRLLEMLSPASHARTPEEMERYAVEPFVIAADVYGVPPHVGRGGWTWYTGSAGWMYRVALESLLGVELRGGRELRIRPCLPRAWPGYRLRYTTPAGACYHVEVERSHTAVSEAELDGRALTVQDRAVVVPLADAPGDHTVRVRLGEDVGPRYEPRLTS